MENKRSMFCPNNKAFASDNYATIHPTVMQAIIQANEGHCSSYGDDPLTAYARALFKQQFGAHTQTFFVCTGTAANVLCLQGLLKPYEAVICAHTAHINTDECGAFERYTGCKIIPIDAPDGKISPATIEPVLGDYQSVHRVQPRVISITQCTESGTLYRPEEIAALAEFAHAHGMYLHMDGARLANAAAALDTSLAALTTEVGVDLVCFGGTKNGMMLGEAVVFLRPELATHFPFIHKQGMQLISKMRFIAAQFVALLENDLWRKNAQQANAMAQLLAQQIQEIPGICLTQPVQTNALFVQLNPSLIAPLQAKFPFYIWDTATSTVRWMTSWDTTEEDIERFVTCLKGLASRL